MAKKNYRRHQVDKNTSVQIRPLLTLPSYSLSLPFSYATNPQ